ncbi:developmental checkpoint coupling sporulation initiation to replication initiation [Paenibacillus aquistagni]|uniref:Developmental checkpoint coupling sporulation initiation to replication initiation n=1 Tax=Paenibacillus aquistagni TaxID=1852522 RepID=A0A1X7LSD5_9BACL|nr:developmental checkpoint coupling sporulation initiation to replication initiation [Paenibacillus aquistagni]
MSDMALLSDELLVDSYYQAVQLNLDEEFIALLLAEIQRRGLHPTIRLVQVVH